MGRVLIFGRRGGGTSEGRDGGRTGEVVRGSGGEGAFAGVGEAKE
jgi:hypothetical protein